jgi:hypothetical protein
MTSELPFTGKSIDEVTNIKSRMSPSLWSDLQVFGVSVEPSISPDGASQRYAIVLYVTEAPQKHLSEVDGVPIIYYVNDQSQASKSSS